VGTYVYASTLHPDMKAKVVVVSRHRHIPSARDDHAQANSIFRAELKAAKGGRKFTPPKDTIQAGNDTLSVVQYAFFPQTLHVAVGTKVTVQVKSLPESHTFTFGPADYLQNLANNFEVPIQPATGPAKIELNGQLSLPSDPGPNLAAYDGTNHGNGFYNTGILDGNKISPRPSSETITFSKAGTYTYTDLLHPSMHGTVIVG
jgi:plastocyanin